MAPSTQTIVLSDDDEPAVTTASSAPTAPGIVATADRSKPAKRKRRPSAISLSSDSDNSDSPDDSPHTRRKANASSANEKAKSKGKTKAPAKRVRTSRTRGQTAKNLESGEADISDVGQDLPEYLVQRRAQFNDSIQRFRDAGLRLPPDYSDIYFSDDEKLQDLDEKPQFSRKSGIKPSRRYQDIQLDGGLIPASIAQYLRDYQVEGVRFLQQFFVYQKGGILGDDMGLGKTVQVAAFLTAAFGKTGDRRDSKRMRKHRRTKEKAWYPRALIICPGSLTQNWKQELDRWGWWETDLYHGSSKDDVLQAALAGRLEIMITTYTTYKNYFEDVNRVPWDVVVADECHHIKDMRSAVAIAMNQVNALCRIGLTGTAIQNKYEELWTLLNWTNPGQFGSVQEWRAAISQPLTIGQSHDATLAQLAEARKTAIKLRDNLLPRFFLRRMKSLIAHQLPKKSDKVVFCPLSDLQREAYQNLVDSDLVDFVRLAYDTCPCASGRKRGWCCYKFYDREAKESWKALVFPIIMSLQKLSSHFNLLIPQIADITQKQKRDLRYLQAAMPQRWKEFFQKRDSIMDLANPEFCGKWKILRQLLRFWHGAGDKVLVFSHSVRLLRILQHLFNNTNYNVSYLDGSLSYEDRQTTVDDFNSDPDQFVFLISTKAGGVGLNITSANKVVIMDPHWNPSYDLQAQDRAYRIGQTRDVDVFRLISTGTIEEITYARQIYKQQQANIGYTASNERRYFKGVQSDSGRKGELFGIMNLLAYHQDEVILQGIVNKTNVAEAKVGIRLADIDMDQAVKDEDDHLKKEDQDDETGGLKQLSSMLTKDTPEPETKQKPKTDSVQAILAMAGVDYTHENSEVVGSSKIETELSRKAALVDSQDPAEQAEHALFMTSQEAFEESFDENMAHFEFLYNPPSEVMLRQFCTMAQTMGFPDATQFALAVESMTQEGRRNCLDNFYRERLEKLRSAAALGSDEGELVAEVRGQGGPSTALPSESETGGSNAGSFIKNEAEPAPGDASLVKDEPRDEGAPRDIASQCISSSVREGAESKQEGAHDLLYSVPPISAKVEDDVKVKSEKPQVSVWLSDDDETDEL